MNGNSINFVAVVTGANRGLGLEVCRQLAAQGFSVVLGSRDLSKGQPAARSLGPGFDVTPCQLDVDDDRSVRAAAGFVEGGSGAVTFWSTTPRSTTT